uniref:Beta-2-microglobulin n=1 Tax=Ornithorhynchus anatinus TaxID=9258 RepID=F6QVH3_ORNAN
MGSRWGIAVLGLFCFVSCLEAITSSPKIQVYSRHPAQIGESNNLNCYVSSFHPPQISIRLLKNGQEMPGVEMSDLSFSNDWTFHRLVHTVFTPSNQDTFECEVVHEGVKKTVKWGEYWDPLSGQVLGLEPSPGSKLLFWEMLWRWGGCQWRGRGLAGAHR